MPLGHVLEPKKRLWVLIEHKKRLWVFILLLGVKSTPNPQIGMSRQHPAVRQSGSPAVRHRHPALGSSAPSSGIRRLPASGIGIRHWHPHRHRRTGTRQLQLRHLVPATGRHRHPPYGTRQPASATHTGTGHLAPAIGNRQLASSTKRLLTRYATPWDVTATLAT